MTAGFWGQYLLALIVVALMLFGLYAIVRGLTRGRLLASNEKRLVGVIDTAIVSQNTNVHIIKAGGKYLLVGGGSGHLSALGEIPADEVEAWLAEQRRAHAAQMAPVAGLIGRLRGKKT
jgi:flagellar biogenesis protein FliO